MTQARNGENRQMPTGALRGIRVLDFGHYIPGPLLGMLLAD
jgi:crotonobetainyl-CoA:carnitine CoA-transferase CaiB-like acyl-CoA transferase